MRKASGVLLKCGAASTRAIPHVRGRVNSSAAPSTDFLHLFTGASRFAIQPRKHLRNTDRVFFLLGAYLDRQPRAWSKRRVGQHPTTERSHCFDGGIVEAL